MALLLKIKPEGFVGGVAIVPQQKSDRLGPNDVGEPVFLWLDDSRATKSHLQSLHRLTDFEVTEMAQVRDPQKSKPAYRTLLELVSSAPREPLTTDDLEQFRYSSGTGGLERLGRLHRDRNDKIFRLTRAETDALESRFGH